MCVVCPLSVIHSYLCCSRQCSQQTETNEDYSPQIKFMYYCGHIRLHPHHAPPQYTHAFSRGGAMNPDLKPPPQVNVFAVPPCCCSFSMPWSQISSWSKGFLQPFSQLLFSLRPGVVPQAHLPRPATHWRRTLERTERLLRESPCPMRSTLSSSGTQ